jgi:hypothetical protein
MEQQRPAAHGAVVQEPSWRWKRDGTRGFARARNGVMRRSRMGENVVDSILEVWGFWKI